MGGLVKGMSGSMKAGGKRGNLKPNARMQNQQLQEMTKALAGANPAILNQLGGMQGINELMKGLNSADVQSMLGGMGGGGMGGLAKMMSGGKR